MVKHSLRPRRVVVTGLGAVTPLGLSVSETWTAALNGKSGIGPTTLFDTVHCPVTISGEVKGFDVTRPVGPYSPIPGQTITQASSSKDVRRVGRFVHLALAAGLEAYADSGLDALRSEISPDRMGVNIGVGMGGLVEIEMVHLEFLEKGYKRVTPFFIPQAIPNMASGQLSILLNLQGPNLCNVTACTSSAHSIGESFRQIQCGTADIMFAGGAEAVIGKLAMAGFASLKALSTRNEEPHRASRPFDQDRDGFVMGEGSAILVLEEYESAKRRKAKIYGEILGYGLSGDAYHMTAPLGAGGQRAMRLALEDAQLKPQDIDYINAHATSTPMGDREEAQGILEVFSKARKQLHVSSTKSMTGHLLGAAGALECLFCLLSLRDKKIPPTINLEHIDPECESLGLNFTPCQAVSKSIQFALSNSFGFGGTNASLIVGQTH